MVLNYQFEENFNFKKKKSDLPITQAMALKCWEHSFQARNVSA